MSRPPGATGFGVAEGLETVKSAARAAGAVTEVDRVKSLSAGVGSGSSPPTVTVSLTAEPLAAPAATWTTRVKVAGAPATRLGVVAVTVPARPGAGP